MKNDMVMRVRCESASLDAKQPCYRCGGAGRGPWFPDGGICYRCKGDGIEPVKVRVAKPARQAVPVNLSRGDWLDAVIAMEQELRERDRWLRG